MELDSVADSSNGARAKTRTRKILTGDARARIRKTKAEEKDMLIEDLLVEAERETARRRAPRVAGNQCDDQPVAGSRSRKPTGGEQSAPDGDSNGSKCRKKKVLPGKNGKPFHPRITTASSSATSAAVHPQRAKDENTAENVTPVTAATAASSSQRDGFSGSLEAEVARSSSDQRAMSWEVPAQNCSTMDDAKTKTAAGSQSSAAAATACPQRATLGSTAKRSTELQNVPKPPAAQSKPSLPVPHGPPVALGPPAHLLPKAADEKHPSDHTLPSTPDAHEKRPAKTAMGVNGRLPSSTVAEATKQHEKSHTLTSSNNMWGVGEGLNGGPSAIRLLGKHQGDGHVIADETQAQPKNTRGASQPVAGSDCAASANPKSNSSIAKSGVVGFTMARIDCQHSRTTNSQQTGARDNRRDFRLGPTRSGIHRRAFSRSPSPSGHSDRDQPQAAGSEPSQFVAPPPIEENFFSRQDGYGFCTRLCASWYEDHVPNPPCGEPEGKCVGQLCSEIFFRKHKDAEENLLRGTAKQWRLFREFAKSDIEGARTEDEKKKAKTGQPLSTDEELMRDLIKYKLRLHSGEVRAWPIWQTETWVPARTVLAARFVRGAAWLQTQASQDSAARRQECANDDGGADIPVDGNMWRPHDIFSDAYLEVECAPDLENAICTLAVRGRGGQGVCLRQVSCITLGEAFYYHGKEHTYDDIYWYWLKGCTVIKRRTFYGPVSKARGVGWVSITRRGWMGWVVYHPPPPPPTYRQCFWNLRLSGFSHFHSNMQQMSVMHFFSGWAQQFHRKLRW